MNGTINWKELGKALPEAPDGDDWWLDEEHVQHRSAMPEPAKPDRPLSLISVIKNAMGKDLMTLPLPVELHEPQTDLQKICENCEYSELVDQAAKAPKHSLERHVLVAAFAVAPYSAAKKTRKSMYALHGETFEAVMPQKHVRYLAEQVSRSPDIMMARMEGRGWLVEIDAEPRPRLWPYALEIDLRWDIRCTFADGDQYSWGTLVTSVNSLTTVKDMYITHTGILHIQNVHTSRTAVVEFGDPGSRITTSARTRQAKNVKLKGYFTEHGKKMDLPKMSGQWDESFSAHLPNGSDWTVWTVKPPPADPSRFGYTSFCMTLNDLPAALKKRLPKTDSRFRPDNRALEDGYNAEASAEKERLEARNVAIVAAAKARKQPVGEVFPPRWFARLPDTAAKGKDGKFGAVRYAYKGGYWEARKAGSFDQSVDLFGDSPITAA